MAWCPEPSPAPLFWLGLAPAPTQNLTNQLLLELHLNLCLSSLPKLQAGEDPASQVASVFEIWLPLGSRCPHSCPRSASLALLLMSVCVVVVATATCILLFSVAGVVVSMAGCGRRWSQVGGGHRDHERRHHHHHPTQYSCVHC